MKNTILIAGVVASLSSAYGQTTFSQTQAFGPSSLSFDDTLTFNQLNLNPADIISVSWSYSITVNGGQMVIDNDGTNPATVNAMFGGELDVTSTDVTLFDPATFMPLIDGVSATTSGIFNLAANVGDTVGDYDPTGPDGATLLGQVSTTSGSASVDNSFWAQYLGTGLIDLDVSADAVASIGTVGGVEFAFTPATANGSLTLNVTAVPEPSSALLSMTGILALGLRRRR
ncbi:PEP-CTERM sorting domain-containing protein [Akkermansiaceae bacterium]|nr:PEP-CTERM sorting domain-containing protein [Akkermansiaceae bacterium]